MFGNKKIALFILLGVILALFAFFGIQALWTELEGRRQYHGTFVERYDALAGG
jgi:predicted outer membrane lipoprotein